MKLKHLIMEISQDVAKKQLTEMFLDLYRDQIEERINSAKVEFDKILKTAQSIVATETHPRLGNNADEIFRKKFGMDGVYNERKWFNSVQKIIWDFRHRPDMLEGRLEREYENIRKSENNKIAKFIDKILNTIQEPINSISWLVKNVEIVLVTEKQKYFLEPKLIMAGGYNIQRLHNRYLVMIKDQSGKLLKKIEG